MVLEELKKRRLIILYIVIYITFFDLAYIFGVSRQYGYLGVTLNINWAKMVVSTITVFCTVLLLPVKMEKVSSYLFFILYIITFLPMASYVWLNDKPIVYYLELFVCFVLIEIYVGFSLNRYKWITVRNGNLILSIALAVYIISSIALIIMNGGIKFKMLDFAIASQSREENISGYAGYLLNWCAKSFMPLFAAYFGYLKKKRWVVLVGALQVGLYFSYGFKSFLLSVAYLLVVTYSLKAGWKFWKILPGLFSGIIVVSLLLYLFRIDNMLLFLFPFRTLALPCEGQFRYYEYFTNFDKLHFAGSSLGKLFGSEYKYTESIGHVISLYFTGNVSNSNTGIFSYAYADFGFPGMLLATLVLIIIFSIIDVCTTHIPKYITVGALSYQMVCMNDTNLTINLFTGGILLSIVMLNVLDAVFREREKITYNIQILEGLPIDEN